jgi:hypothetical protein
MILAAGFWVVLAQHNALGILQVVHGANVLVVRAQDFHVFLNVETFDMLHLLLCELKTRNVTAISDCKHQRSKGGRIVVRRADRSICRAFQHDRQKATESLPGAANWGCAAVPFQSSGLQRSKPIATAACSTGGPGPSECHPWSTPLAAFFRSDRYRGP